MPSAYIYPTSVGTFRIRPDPSDSSRWELDVITDSGSESLGAYVTPKSAASDVYGRVTGFTPWDNLPLSADGGDIENLAQWNAVRTLYV